MDARQEDGRRTWDVRAHPEAAAELAILDAARYARVRLALMRLADEPFRPRPGLDVRHVKLRAQDGVPLYRLRVGDVRAVFALLEEEREALVLVVQKREVGYPRMLKTAMRRLR